MVHRLYQHEELFSLLIFKGVNTFDVIWNTFKLFSMFKDGCHGCEFIAQSQQEKCRIEL